MKSLEILKSALAALRAEIMQNAHCSKKKQNGNFAYWFASNYEIIKNVYLGHALVI
jgi:hypothetical protein